MSSERPHTLRAAAQTSYTPRPEPPQTLNQMKQRDAAEVARTAERNHNETARMAERDSNATARLALLQNTTEERLAVLRDAAAAAQLLTNQARS